MNILESGAIYSNDITHINHSHANFFVQGRGHIHQSLSTEVELLFTFPSVKHAYIVGMPWDVSNGFSGLSIEPDIMYHGYNEIIDKDSNFLNFNSYRQSFIFANSIPVIFCGMGKSIYAESNRQGLWKRVISRESRIEHGKYLLQNKYQNKLLPFLGNRIKITEKP